ncbi:MAG: type II toxin-antitoxin system HicB family antitoxin [Candidatus Aenigmatarchaeota archaeon]
MDIIFSAVFRKEVEGGYSALCPELGVASQGETVEEAESSLKEACELYMESAKDVGILKKVLEDAGINNRETITNVLTGSFKAEVAV